MQCFYLDMLMGKNFEWLTTPPELTAILSIFHFLLLRKSFRDFWDTL